MNNGILICIPIIIACIWFANSKSSEYNQKKRELEDFARKLTVRKNELDKTEASLNVKKANISAKDMEINNRINALKGLEIIFSSKISTIPVLSKFFADIKMEKEKHLSNGSIIYFKGYFYNGMLPYTYIYGDEAVVLRRYMGNLPAVRYA